MAGKEDYRIFVGGLSWDVTERELESKFSRFGKVIESQIMLERDTGRPRGFGFITFSDRRGMETAIKEMHGREYGNRVISVNKAQPKVGDDVDHGYRGGGYSSGDRDRDRDRGSYGRGGDRVERSAVGQDNCFKCGRAGHWARDCPSGDGGGRGGGGPFSSRSRFGGPVGHGDRFGGDRDRFIDDRYDAARSRDRERFDIRDDKYSSRDRFASDRYPSGGGGGDRFGSNRYGGADRYAQNGYGKERGYERDNDARGGASDRYGGGSGGAVRNEGRNYRSRPDPYERPSRAARPSSFDRY